MAFLFLVAGWVVVVVSSLVALYGVIFQYRVNGYGISRARYFVDVGFGNLWTWLEELLGAVIIRAMLRFILWKKGWTRQELYERQHEFSLSEINNFLDTDSVFKLILPFRSIFEFCNEE